VRFFDRFWTRLSGGGAAERAELAGDLAGAIRLWVAAGDSDEAARVMIVRGDGEPDPRARLQHYAQAAALANNGSTTQKAARAKKARLTVSLAGDGVLSTALRRDVLEAAEALESIGEAEAAARAYALAGDTDGEARALAQAGDIERLEDVLTRDQSRTREGRLAQDVHAQIDGLLAAGQRREALSLAEVNAEDPAARSRASRLRGARISGPIVRVSLRAVRLTLVLGDEVTLGRTEGAITIASSALSRKHLQVTRAGPRFVVADLGSRNGTLLRGLALAHPLEIGGGVTLSLGGEVPLTIAPSTEVEDALAIEVAGERYVASLGDAKLGVGAWRIVTAPDGWVELVTTRETPAFLGGLAMAPTVSLLRGDAFSSERGGDVVLRIDE
jgi:hypothetical protein